MKYTKLDKLNQIVSSFLSKNNSYGITESFVKRSVKSSVKRGNILTYKPKGENIDAVIVILNCKSHDDIEDYDKVFNEINFSDEIIDGMTVELKHMKAIPLVFSKNSRSSVGVLKKLFSYVGEYSFSDRYPNITCLRYWQLKFKK